MKVSVLSCGGKNRSEETEALNNRAGTHVVDAVHNLGEGFVAHFGSPERVGGDSHGLCFPDGIRDRNLATFGETGSDDGLRNVTRHICAASIHLRGIFS